MSFASLRLAASPLSIAGFLSALGLALIAQSAGAVTTAEMRKVVSSPGKADQKTIDTYLRSDLFRHFVNPAGGGVMLPNLRKDFGNISRGVGKTPSHDYLNDKAFGFASQVVDSKDPRFTVASKYAAMLLIGDLAESDTPGSMKPYLPALKKLVETLAIDPSAENAYLKPAALAAIGKFASEPGALPPAAIPAISDALVKILNQTDAPPGMSGSAHNFMRRSAAAALAAIGNPGPNNEILKAFEAIAADPNARMTFRCEIAQYLGQLKLTPANKVDYRALANLIGWMTTDLCEQELENSTESNQTPSRRLLMYALDSGSSALVGLRRSAEKDAEASKFITGVGSKISALQRTLDNVDDTPDDQIATKVAPELEAIRTLLDPKPAAPEPLVSTGVDATGRAAN